MDSKPTAPPAGSLFQAFEFSRVQNFAWLILNRSTVVLGFHSECSHSWPYNQKAIFNKNFQGFTYCSVFKVLCCWYPLSQVRFCHAHAAAGPIQVPAGIICIPPAAFCLGSNVPYHITLLCVCQQLSYFPLALFEEPWPVFQGEYYNSKRIPKSQPLFSLFFILFSVFFRQLNPVVLCSWRTQYSPKVPNFIFAKSQNTCFLTSGSFLTNFRKFFFCLWYDFKCTQNQQMGMLQQMMNLEYHSMQLKQVN